MPHSISRRAALAGLAAGAVTVLGTAGVARADVGVDGSPWAGFAPGADQKADRTIAAVAFAGFRVVRAVPGNLRRKLEPQELFSQIIQHKWLLSERAGRDVGMAPAVQSYLTDVLARKPDEQAVLGVEVSALT